MKHRLLAMSLIFACADATDGMLPSAFLNAPQFIGQTIPQSQIRWKKLRRVTPSTYIRKQEINLNSIKVPNLDYQMTEIGEYFHKSSSQQRNNQDSINLNRTTTTPNFVQSNPMGRNPVPTELARPFKLNESIQFIQQKRELLQSQNTSVQKKVNEELEKQKELEQFLELELEKFFSFEGIAMDEGNSEPQEISSSTTVKSETQQTETTISTMEDSSSVLFRKKNKTEMTLDPIFLKYERDKNLSEFVDRIRVSLPINLFRKGNIYIKKIFQILESDDITGEYSARFLTSFLNKKYSGRYNKNNVSTFVRVIKNMRYHDLVRAYNLYPPIILEPVNGMDIVSALKPIKFSGKQGKLKFLEKYYEKAIENINQDKFFEKATE